MSRRLTPASSSADRRSALERRQYLTLLAAGLLGGIAGCSDSGSPTTPQDTPSAEGTVTPPATDSPTETTESAPYEIERDVMVPMRDGVALATDLYLPREGEGPYPTLLNRTPYSKDQSEPVGGVVSAVESGYAVVHQDVRGRFKSEGAWEPFFYEAEDGHDAVEWAADRDWSTGDVGMYGNSYMGMTTWQAILAEPPSLVAAAPFITPTDYYAHLQYTGGMDNVGTSMFWTAFTSLAHVPRMDVSKEKADEFNAELGALLQNFPDGVSYLPTIEQPAFDEGVAPHWRDWHEHPTYDDYWEELDVLRRIDDISIPVVHAGGWYDIFLEGHTALFSAVEERGTDVVADNQHMVVGPWVHETFATSNPAGDRSFGPNAAFDLAGELIVPWFDRWLKGEGDGLGSSPTVRYFQMGADEWRTADSWPPAGGELTDFYLLSDGNANTRSGDGTLSTEAPAASEPADGYTYDPLDPVPTHGGPLLMGPAQPAGVKDQRAVEDREDVLVYTTAALPEPVEIAGEVEATLFVETTAEDTDFVTRLVDVGPDGYAANITEGALRARYRDGLEEANFLEPGEVYELAVELRDVAHTFAPGHRIRLDVTSSNFPKLDRNPNAAMPVAEAMESDMQTADQTLHHDADRPSRVTLPVTN